jgi:hypothetical protein
MKPPLELFSLEEKAAQVAGWPFHFGAVLGCQLSEKPKAKIRSLRTENRDLR